MQPTQPTQPTNSRTPSAGRARASRHSRVIASIATTASAALVLSMAPAYAAARPDVSSATSSSSSETIDDSIGTGGIGVRAQRATKSGRSAIGLAEIAGKPLRGAKVSLRTRSGTPISLRGSAKTNKSGVFSVTSAATIPASFYVEVTGGKFGKKRNQATLSAMGSRKEVGQYVNLVTTVAAKYSKQHPGLSFKKVNKKVARFLGMPAGKQVFALGQQTGVRSSAFTPKKFLTAANRNGGFSAYTSALAAKAGRSGSAKHFRPSSYGAPEFVSGIMSDLLEDGVKNIINGIACDNGASSVGVLAMFFGCADDDRTDEVINAVNKGFDQMTSALTDISQQLTNLNIKMDQELLVGAYRSANLTELQTEIPNWNLEMKVVAGTKAAPFKKLSRGARVSEMCDAAYPDNDYVKGYNQTAFDACKGAAISAAKFKDWFAGLFAGLTGYAQNGQVGNLLMPLFVRTATAGGTRMMTGKDANSLDDLYSSYLRLMLNGLANTVSWLSFESLYQNGTTGKGCTLPASYNGSALPIAFNNPCTGAVTINATRSVLRVISQNGPSRNLPDEIVINPSADSYRGTAWWPYPLDMTAQSSHDSPDYPFYPGYPRPGKPGNPGRSYTPDFMTKLSAWARTDRAAGLAVDLNVPLTFRLPTEDQARGLVDAVTVAFRSSSTSDAGFHGVHGANAGMQEAGFVGTGDTAVNLHWYDLITGVDNYSVNTREENCSLWPETPQQPSVYFCSRPGFNNTNFSGLWGTHYFKMTDRPYQLDHIGHVECERRPESTDISPGPNPRAPDNRICIGLRGPNGNSDKGYYSVLVADQRVMWAHSDFQEWIGKPIPAAHGK